MKPVLQTILDKNGGSFEQFTPTARMILFSIYKAKNPGLGDGDIAAQAKIDPQLPRKWAEKYGTHYLTWLEEAVEFQIDDDAMVLERVGMIQAMQPGNFSYFKEMAKIKGLIKEEAKAPSISINTNFNAVLMGGGDFEDARKRILEAYRGVVDTGKPRVVDAPEFGLQGSNPSERSGASPLQAGPVEVVNALDKDRGHAEQGVPVPAVSQQGSPASAHRVLGKRAKTSSS